MQTAPSLDPKEYTLPTVQTSFSIFSSILLCSPKMDVFISCATLKHAAKYSNNLGRSGWAFKWSTDTPSFCQFCSLIDLENLQTYGMNLNKHSVLNLKVSVINSFICISGQLHRKSTCLSRKVIRFCEESSIADNTPPPCLRRKDSLMLDGVLQWK